jgi:tripartite-type tricarboxylate transporter receptor subunit TctC
MKTRNILCIILALAITVFAFSACSAGGSQQYPGNKPITMIVPHAAGGSIDRMARGIATYLGPQMGTSVVVENKEGGNAQVGFEYVLNAEPDGYTMLAGVQPYLSNSILRQGAPYTVEDFDIMSVPLNDPASITTLEAAPYNNLEELVNYIKANPGEITIGLSANSGPQMQWDVVVRALSLVDGTDFRTVTYDGTDYRQALLGGHVDIMASSASGDQAMVGVKVLAIAQDEPFLGWEGVPSINKCLEPFGAEVRYVGAMRFLAFDKQFKIDYPDRWNTMQTALQAVFDNAEYKALLEQTGETSVVVADSFNRGTQMVADFHAVVQELETAG